MPFKTKFSSTDSQIKTSFSQKETEFDSGLDEDARVGAIVIDVEKLKKEDAVLYKMITDETERATKAEETLACMISDYPEINFGDGFIVTENTEGSVKKKDVVLDTEYINEELILPALQDITQKVGNLEQVAAVIDITKPISGYVEEEIDKKISDWEKSTSNTATSEILGRVKIDDRTIKMNEKQQIYVAEVSTDRLAQGEKTLVLNGGNDL